MKNMNRGQLIVSMARLWIGTPYQHQASIKGVGCDCLGLVRGVWRDVVGEEPELPGPYSSTWAETGRNESLLEAATKYFTRIEPRLAGCGDVYLFRMRRNSIAKHLAIRSEGKMIIHAYDGNQVVEGHLSEFWLQKVAGVFRFPERDGS